MTHWPNPWLELGNIILILSSSVFLLDCFKQDEYFMKNTATGEHGNEMLRLKNKWNYS